MSPINLADFPWRPVSYTHLDVYKRQAYKGMGTTLEAVAIIGNQAIYAHIGDSRIGLIRGEDYRQLTSDHSLVNALLKAGQLTPEAVSYTHLFGRNRVWKCNHSPRSRRKT